MASKYRNCRVCGAPYKECKSIRPDSDIFNWREVACSPECGNIYFKQILESRAEQSTTATKSKRKTSKAKQKEDALEV